MPMAPPRACVVCGKACADGRCDKHKRPKTNDRYERGKQRRADKRFYSRKRWKTVAGAAMNASDTDPGMCVMCLAKGKHAPAVDVDHIVERKADESRAYDLGNLQPLCKSCHAAKSNRERKEAKAT